MPLVAGVDSSTQSTKVELRDLGTGAVVGFGQSPHTLPVPPVSEQEPAEWWQALCRAMAQARQQARTAGRASEVVAISVAAQQHGLVPLDADRHVLRPAVLWNDTRSGPDAAWLSEQLPPEGWADACGSVPVAAFTIAKLSWLHRIEPTVFDALSHVLLPHDWLTLQLTGRLSTDRGDASGTGYWSPSDGGYRYDLLSLVSGAIANDDAVPEVLGPWEQAGSVTAEAAEQLGVEVGTVVAVGTGDNMAAALGVGLRSGELAVSIGTSGTVFTSSPVPAADPSGAVAGFADATGQFLPLVCTLNAALVTDYVAHLLAVDPEVLDAMALAAPPGADGLVLVPYLAGERVPNRPEASGSWHGIRQGTSRESLARSAYEGVVCGLLDGLDALAAGTSVDDGPMLLLGGGSKSAAYRQILASLSGRAVRVPHHPQSVSAGAAVQAAVLATGSDHSSIVEAWDLRQGSITEPADESQASIEVRQRYHHARG
jgi:xylulokinase